MLTFRKKQLHLSYVLHICLLTSLIWRWLKQSWVSTFFPNDQNKLKFYRLRVTILIWYCTKVQKDISYCWFFRCPKHQCPCWTHCGVHLSRCDILNWHLAEKIFFKKNNEFDKNIMMKERKVKVRTKGMFLVRLADFGI